MATAPSLLIVISGLIDLFIPELSKALLLLKISVFRFAENPFTLELSAFLSMNFENIS